MVKRLKILSISSVGNRKRPFSYRSRIGLVSVSYQSRINPVLIPYRSRIDPVSFSYRSPIILASGSGNNTETIRKRCGFDTRSIGGARKEQGRNVPVGVK